MTELALVTGAAGFIGSHVCNRLLGAGWAVRGVDNFDPFYHPGIKESAVADLRRRGDFTLQVADVRDAGAMARAARDCRLVVHLAARAGVRPSLGAAGEYRSINVHGTLQVLEACRRAKISRFVFGSSSSVYGDAATVPFREDTRPGAPLSPYAATKQQGEASCYQHARRYGGRMAVLRFFTVYGPGQRPDLAAHAFTRRLAAGRPLRQFGDGSSRRDYTHIDDVVQGVMGAVHWTERAGPGFEIFNLGTSRAVRLSHLVQLVARALNVAPAVERHPPQPGDVPQTCADITKARRVLGYRPTVPVETGIPQFVQWYEGSYGRELRSAP